MGRLHPFVACLVLSGSAIGQPCQETWFPQFVNADLNGEVSALLEHEEQGQPVLYVAGQFGTAGGNVNAGLVRWDGLRFSAVGTNPLLGVRTMVLFDDDGGGPGPTRLYAGGTMSGLINKVARLVGDTWEEVGTPPLLATVDRLAVCDHGAGPILYAAGDFPGVRRLDGGAWVAVGAGPIFGEANALQAFDEDGGGPNPPSLFVGGFYWELGGNTIRGIARWDGTQWSVIGTDGTNVGGYVNALEVHDEDGPGSTPPALFAGGNFTTIDGVQCANIARWDGQQWTPLGQGLVNPISTSTVNDLRSIDDDGAGSNPPGLYAGGSFATAGGQAAPNIAVWRSGSWSGFSNSPDHFVHAIEAITPPGEEPVIFTGGAFLFPGPYLARLEGNAWKPMSNSVMGTVSRLAALTHAGETRLYVGGTFQAVGGGLVPASNVAAWDGEQWHGLGSGVNGEVKCFTMHDSGSGPDIYAGGQFTLGNGLAANRIATLQGGAWSTFDTGADGPVYASIAHDDDGAGPNPTSLFVGGGFSAMNGTPTTRLAKWDGSTWSSMGTITGPTGVHSFAVYNSQLYIGGNFFHTPAGGSVIRSLAVWDGASLQAVGGSVSPLSGDVQALRVYDDGTGSRLYAAGKFENMGGAPFTNIARWNGTSWASVGSGVGVVGDYVFALEPHNDGSGTALYAGGTFMTAGGVQARRVARWRNGVWSAVGVGITNGSEVRALKVFNGSLYAAGSFDDSGGVFVRNIARWTGSSWAGLGNGLNNSALALEIYNDGSGNALYIGGQFATFTGFNSPGLVKWTGSTFAPSGAVGGATPHVYGLNTCDTGSGPALVVGGPFTTAGIESVNRISRWTGTVWGGLGTGINGTVSTMTSFDPDGAGPGSSDLFVAGAFSQAGTVAAANIARWNGASWAPLGAGTSQGISAITGFDDGSGPALYVAGGFTNAGGLAARGIARWTPAGWSLVGNAELSGSQSQGYTLAVYNDGSGPALYLGGSFTSIHNGTKVIQTKYIARWNGAAWAVVGDGLNAEVTDLAVLDSGSGPFLYACGGFDLSGTTPLNRIGRWDGAVWSALDSGLNAGAHTMAALEDGLGPAVYVGSNTFTQSGNVSAKRIARWGCGPDIFGCYPDCSGDGVLTVSDFGCFQTRYATASPYCDCNGDLLLTVADFGCFQTKFVLGCP